ncbi:MAG TPA: hypothetical protein VJK54_05720, partial [Chthoniobacterales bacterium]|nr:hypothetical protein [Chthoniobacterales bacterium]
QVAADRSRKEVEAFLQGDREKGARYQTAAQVTNCSALCLKYASDALEKALEVEAQGKATTWRNVTTQYRVVADWHRQEAEAFLQGDQEKETYFEAAAEVAVRLAVNLDIGSQAFDKALKAEAQGKSKLATAWKKATRQYHVAVHWYRQEAEAFFQSDQEKRAYYRTVADIANLSAECLNSASQALDKSLEANAQYQMVLKTTPAWRSSELAIAWKNEELEKAWGKVAIEYQVAADYRIQETEAFLQGDQDKSTCFKATAKAAEESAKHLESAANVLEKEPVRKNAATRYQQWNPGMDAVDTALTISGFH